MLKGLPGRKATLVSGGPLLRPGVQLLPSPFQGRAIQPAATPTQTSRMNLILVSKRTENVYMLARVSIE